MRLNHTRTLAAVLALALGGTATPAQEPAPAPPAEKQKKEKKEKKPKREPGSPKRDPRVKLAEPWQEPDKLRERAEDAVARKLFASEEPLAFTLTADFKAINKDRHPDSVKRFPATLKVAGDDGQERVLNVDLRSRGHSRLVYNCGFVPIRVEFPPKAETKGTPFAKQETLKLGTHCHGSKEYEQYALREYLSYKILNLFTPRSFRARLAKARYVDVKTGELLFDKYAMFLEAESDVARRLEGRIATLPRVVFRDLEQDSLTLMMLFEYMIGNTDFSIYALHNVRLVQDSKRTLFAVPYDFDYGGLTDARYAVPAKALNLKTVLERAYRGPCRTLEELQPFVASFLEKKPQVMALVESVPGFDNGSRRHARTYLEQFYETIGNRGSLKRELVDGCSKKAGM
jgi:hypothetical protein